MTTSPAAPRAPLLPPSSVASRVLATLAIVVALWWGRSFMIPLTAGAMLALLVVPLTALLTRGLRSRIAAAVLTLMIVVATLGLAAAAFGDQLARVAGRAPDMISLVAQQLAETEPGVDSVVQRVRASLRELDRAAERFAGIKPTVTRSGRAAAAKAAELAASASAGGVTISQTASVALRNTAVSGSGALMRLAGDLTVVLFIAFFLLVGGAPLADRMLDLWNDRPHADRVARECMRQIHLYGGVLLVTNTIVGLAVWGAFAFAGLPDAAGWGITAAVLHVVPYLGMALLTALGAAEAFVAHGTFGAALGVAAFIVLWSTLVGTVVAAWMQGRAAKMNPAAVFIGVVFWGALWGAWGLLLGPALVVLLKVVAENWQPTRAIARLMQG